ncbi:3-oxoacyl-ACP synthase III family protein [Azospirillum doebereinerae]|uniref:Ketoacyl-ACP synthase III n=1 Tax=Azospirillum doebereinerae TaxID=92933 RepID=A0A3S1CIS5_9PROT|nr:ketoacyl-ACP synthase III [Azospirillum doebereinerae]MCG5238497.1 ketoacyl-ACP synthase III [Azospirillum doebereinerae]RUQ74577.1 ketoacyl-ACP synthase III [Azospirillum doebereinerae]
MVASVLDGVALRGVVGCVPERRETVADLALRFGEDAAARIAKATGIEARHLVDPDQCTSDLAEAAAHRLLDGLGWEPSSVDLLVLVTQTHDHVLPGSGALLHHRLGLRKGAAVLDLTQGCSGFVYGLWTASALLKSAGHRALLIVGDTTSRLIDPSDRAVAPLFGDGAAAVALETAADAGPMVFDLGSDGAGAPYLTAAGGAMRHPGTPARLFMDGTQVFAFTLREVPASVRAALDGAGWSMAEVDHLVLHQANAQMIRHLAQKLGATPEQTVLALSGLGNTSSASIPLALTEALAAPLMAERRRLLLSGFGVGWSWGSVALSAGPLTLCATVVLPGRKYPANSAASARTAGDPANSAER